jgi:tRNA(Glu) U13 pseudouridine synthase TruD
LADPEQTDTQRKQFLEPTVVTSENITQFTLHDVVLPLVGYDITYPPSPVGKLYKTWLAEDSLSVEDLKHKVKLVKRNVW